MTQRLRTTALGGGKKFFNFLDTHFFLHVSLSTTFPIFLFLSAVMFPPCHLLSVLQSRLRDLSSFAQHQAHIPTSLFTIGKLTKNNRALLTKTPLTLQSAHLQLCFYRCSHQKLTVVLLAFHEVLLLDPPSENSRSPWLPASNATVLV